MERRFHCTACGKCCTGWLPLTIRDALAHAGRFPLAVIWTPVRQGGKSYDLIRRLGVTIKLKRKKEAAVRISPTAYIPKAFPCPSLGDDNLCAIHDDKPSRCRAMPFSPYNEETDQAELLIPRAGWECDTSAEAPVVYRDGKIVSRDDYERERDEVEEESRILRAYGDWLFDAAPSLQREVLKIALSPAGGHVVVNFATLLPRLPGVDVFDFAEKQLPVLRDFIARTKGRPELADYHKRYREYAKELESKLAHRG